MNMASNTPGAAAAPSPKPVYGGSGKLAGQVALIGGGDAGIGRAVAMLFARESADVAIVHLDQHEAALETRKWVEAEGHSCLVLAGDVGDADFCRQAVDTVIAQYGRLDVLVNNANFRSHSASLIELGQEALEQTMRANVYGYVQLTRAALPYLNPGAAIVNTASSAQFRGISELLDYATSEGAVQAFTRALAVSLQGRGIRVNAVAPGQVHAPPVADEIAPDAAGQAPFEDRAVDPDELAPAYVFLASALFSRRISGVVLPVASARSL